MRQTQIGPLQTPYNWKIDTTVKSLIVFSKSWNEIDLLFLDIVTVPFVTVISDIEKEFWITFKWWFLSLVVNEERIWLMELHKADSSE